RLRRVLPGLGPVSVVAFAPRGGRMLVAGTDGRVHVDHRTFGVGAPVREASFSRDGKRVVVTAGRRVSVFDVASGGRLPPPRRRVRVLDDGGGQVNDAEFSPDGSLLATAGEDGAVRVWNVARGDRLFYFPGHTNPVVAVAWSPNGRFVADASLDRSAHISEVEGVEVGQRVANLTGHRAGVTSLAWSPDGRSLLTGSADG